MHTQILDNKVQTLKFNSNFEAKRVQFLAKLEHEKKMKNFISNSDTIFRNGLLSSASGFQEYRKGGLICKKVSLSESHLSDSQKGTKVTKLSQFANSVLPGSQLRLIKYQ